MRQRLSADAYEAWQQCMTHGTPLPRSIADQIAAAMKDWAIEQGATHYTHWFQPMTGVTAEKHDSFITPAGNGRRHHGVLRQGADPGRGRRLLLPSGGLRATFEARGYTAWDPTSYAFIKDRTLYIPTVFCSYSGQTLDKKTPLLRSMQAAGPASAMRILRLFGNTEAQHVISAGRPGAGVFPHRSEAMYQPPGGSAKLCGRTLFGARPPRARSWTTTITAPSSPG
ncbi:MAG: glutamine synthetase III [Oscillospiraceae bacterium]